MNWKQTNYLSPSIQLCDLGPSLSPCLRQEEINLPLGTLPVLFCEVPRQA